MKYTRASPRAQARSNPFQLIDEMLIWHRGLPASAMGCSRSCRNKNLFGRNVSGKAGSTFDELEKSSGIGKQEARMIKAVIKLGTLATFLVALSTASSPTPAFAAGGGGGGGGEPSSAYPASSYPPSSPSAYPKRSGTKATHKLKKSKQSSLEDSTFGQGYRAAYATIYDRNDYAAAIEQLKALGHDDHPNVANLIGYSYRKLGDYKLSQVWYERALKADPNHVLTWQYYGLWQIEQGNRDQAQYHLGRIAAICGTDCDEYRSLAAALEKPPGTGLVY
jgi:tetratricopeptide (TPR) repeat protein